MPMKKKTKKPRKPRSSRTRLGSATPGSAPVSPYGWDAPAPQPRLHPRRDTPTTLTIHVELAGSEPLVWRRLVVSGAMTLDVVHRILQGAMGWDGGHLHGYQVPATDGEHWASIVDEFAGEPGAVLEKEVRLDEVLTGPDDVVVYEYDFGDSWIHVLRLESERAREPDDPPAAVLDGARACPPEDVGGIYGYQHIVAALAGQTAPDEDLDYLLEGLEEYDPDAFDASLADRWVRHSVPALR
jgi:hypothetical protein